MRARDGELGLSPELATVAARRQPQSSTGGVASGGGIQRGGEWGQGFAEVPRVAVRKQELACGPPRRRTALLCAGGRGSREGGRWKMKGGRSYKF
jgi:hypothetical protein